MGCGKSKAVRAAEQPELQAGGQSGQGCGSPAQHHLPCQTLPKNPATGVSGPSGSTGTTFIDPRAQLRAYIDSHPVVIFSKSSCTYCTEVKKLFKSMRVPYFLLELDQAGSVLSARNIAGNQQVCFLLLQSQLGLLTSPPPPHIIPFRVEGLWQPVQCAT
ncbi:thioredoxin reductase 1, cytoplasmic-like [Rousettus aegyptiacus]|uniref:thioredoxin reductase 1, cytoplasmic-like n=1 Tax=Rousettus aegyptiacus TaxID=9407 RepID=UPI00168CDE02|nr:thioredoxin reductase 1, cytoplasmic-like [Rousettus aegyptiacus]